MSNKGEGIKYALQLCSASALQKHCSSEPSSRVGFSNAMPLSASSISFLHLHYLERKPPGKKQYEKKIWILMALATSQAQLVFLFKMLSAHLLR